MRNFMICLVSMSWQASVIILVTVLLRKLFEAFHLSSKYIMMLWLVPYFFLVFPWKLASPVALWVHAPVDYQIERTVQAEDENLNIFGNGDFPVPGKGTFRTREEANSGTIREGVKETYQETNSGTGQLNVQEVQQEGIVAIGWGGAFWISWIVWGMGISVLLAHSIIAYVKLRRRLICSVCIRDNIYFADDISTPMVVGIFHPRIYIPSGVKAECQAYAIWHEETHIRRKDPLTKMLAFLVTGLHWFNPLAWLAYCLFCRDMEMACDEETVQRIGPEKRKDYANALVVLSTGKRRAFTLPPAFGEGDTAGRVKNIFIFKKPKKFLTGIMMMTGILLGFCFITKSEAAQAGAQREGNLGANAPRIDAGDGGSALGMDSAVDGTADIRTEYGGEPKNVPADGAPTVMAPGKVAKEGEETGGVSLWHREGYQETVVHLFIPKKYEELWQEIGEADRELLDQKAQRALRELYDLTGTQVEECYYYVYIPGELMAFGKTPDDLEHGRDFMARGFSDITTMDIASARRVWYSDVNMYALPEGYAKMTEKEKAIWFVTHSGLWNGKQAVEAVQPYGWDGNIWHVIMEDDTAYEIILDSEVESFSNLTGPYPSSDIRH